jgi:hypothetical protein
MVDKLHSVMIDRIQLVLGEHLSATEGELEQAATAVVAELLTMGALASRLPGCTADLSMELANQRDALARQLTAALTSDAGN